MITPTQLTSEVMILKCYYNRGMCHQALRQFIESTQDFSKVIELEPDTTRGWVSRSINHHFIKDMYQPFQTWTRPQRSKLTMVRWRC